MNETSAEGDMHPPPGEDWTEALRFWLRFALEGVLVAVVANCGIFGNVVSAFILLRRRLDLQPFLCRYF